MTLFEAILLGVIQGLTEFLPVSSSGHLVLAQHFIDLNRDAMAFDAFLHLGTLFAVVLYFRKELTAMARSLGRFARSGERDDDTRIAGWLALASLPAAGAGFILEPLLGQAFNSVGVVGIMLIVTGTVLWLAETVAAGSRGLGGLRAADSLVVGLAQAVAILPGISRSGATIAAGMWRGISREEAARFSFLLSIPIILGATAFSWLSTGLTATPVAVMGAGIGAAGLSGLAAIAVLMRILAQEKLRLFAVYCFIVGVTALALSLSS